MARSTERSIKQLGSRAYECEETVFKVNVKHVSTVTANARKKDMLQINQERNLDQPCLGAIREYRALERTLTECNERMPDYRKKTSERASEPTSEVTMAEVGFSHRSSPSFISPMVHSICWSHILALPRSDAESLRKEARNRQENNKEASAQATQDDCAREIRPPEATDRRKDRTREHKNAPKDRMNGGL